MYKLYRIFPNLSIYIFINPQHAGIPGLTYLLCIREVKIDVYGGPVTANAKLQVRFSGEVLAVRN